MKKLSIYIHIPFCVRKCLYCDFLSFPPVENDIVNYVNQLTAEVDFAPVGYDIDVSDPNYDKNYVVDTVYFGGGTPSLIEPGLLDDILCKLKCRFVIEDNAEISMEMNPGTANESYISQYRRIGVNRLSIGLQSAHMRELTLLGRIHTYEDFLKTYTWARNAGFQNVNVDVMAAVPGQSLQSYEETLQRVCDLAPEHISAYSLIVEPGTPFAAHTPDLPDEDTEREMYYLTKRLLTKNGYDRYEISNYAKQGYECRHNIGYWTGKDYLGFGLGAASKIANIRFKNTSLMNEYLKDVADLRRERQELTAEDSMEEFMFLGLRLMRGVDIAEFQTKFGSRILDIYGNVIQKLISQKLIIMTQERIFLTDYGVDVSNYVFTQFLLGE